MPGEVAQHRAGARGVTMLAYSGQQHKAAPGAAPDVAEANDLDRAQVEELFARYRPRVLGLCRRLLGRRETAEDACQEALAKAYEALPRFRVGSPMWPWLATIAANACRDAARREHPETSIDVLDRVDTVDLEELVSRRSRAGLVREAVASLPSSYRNTVELRDLEGWSYSDIADLRGRSVGSVRTTLMRGRRALAARIEELARERREWPLAGVPVMVDAYRRLRARVAARLQPTVDAFGAASSRLDGAIAALSAAPLSVMAPVAAAAALASLTLMPSEASTAAGTARAARPVVVASSDDSPPADAGAMPTAPASRERASTGEAPAPVETPALAVAAEAPAPEDTPADAETPDGFYIAVGPTGLYCGEDEDREQLTEIVCDVVSP